MCCGRYRDFCVRREVSGDSLLERRSRGLPTDAFVDVALQGMIGLPTVVVKLARHSVLFLETRRDLMIVTSR